MVLKSSDIDNSEHDPIASARTVKLVDALGNDIDVSNPLPVDTELTLDGNLIIDNVSIFATDISDSTSTSFSLVNSLGHQFVQPGVIDGRSKEYEDTSFVTGDSPVVHDVNTDLARNAVTGYITCDGPGNILVEFSNDGLNYGGQHTMKVEDTINFEHLNVDKIRITWVSNSAYRIFVV